MEYVLYAGEKSTIETLTDCELSQTWSDWNDYVRNETIPKLKRMLESTDHHYRKFGSPMP